MVCSIILSDGDTGSIFSCLSSLGASQEVLWVCSGRFWRFPRNPKEFPCLHRAGMVPPAPHSGLHGILPSTPSLWPCRAALGGSRECRRRSLPPGVCPGQTNPRNLGPVYKKPRGGCSVPRSIWECLGLEQGLSRCRVITWVLLRPHQSRQPLISGSSWHDKGTVLSPTLCTAPGLGWDLDGAGIQPHSEAGLVGCKGGLSSKKGSFSPKMSHLQPRQREQGAGGVHLNSPRVLAGAGWGCLCCCNEFAGLSSPLWWEGAPHLLHPPLTRHRSLSASSPP